LWLSLTIVVRSFSQKVAPSVWRMQLTLIAGGYYLLEPDLCRSRNISGVST